MPLLVFTSTGFPFVPFTKIFSADVNQTFNDIKTLLNTTKLDDTNLQNAGITPTTKLNQTGSTAGQFLSSNGSAVIWANNPVSAQYNYILGSAAQVASGSATNSTFASIVQADGDRILILPGYVTSESWTVTKKLFITGLGNTSQITGSVTFATGSSKAIIKECKVTTGITTNSGVDGVHADEGLWFPTGITFTDNSTQLANFLQAIQET